MIILQKNGLLGVLVKNHITVEVGYHIIFVKIAVKYILWLATVTVENALIVLINGGIKGVELLTIDYWVLRLKINVG
jgi:2-phosphoglycerate kinase